jgi:glycosyltransferase involved in cell wall biosynthesis
MTTTRPVAPAEVAHPQVARDVFIVCNNFEELGGVQRWVHNIARLFAARGHRVRLIGITHAEELASALPYERPYETTVLHDISPGMASQVNRLNLAGRIRRRRRQATVGRGVARLSEPFRAARPGGIVIVAQVWAMEWVAQADTAGLRVIGMSHESYAATRASSRYARVMRFYADADRMLVLTDQDAAAWARAGMTNVEALPNPLPVTPDLPARLTEPVVVALGRLSFEKGLDMLLATWAEVTASGSGSGWRLRLYGSGEEEQELRDQAASLGIAGCVEFAGPAADPGAALSQASVLALSSRAEGFPMAVLEAMACGVPCVAFDCAPGIRELIKDSCDGPPNGIVVPLGNTREFAAALSLLIADERLRRELGANGRRSVRRFDPGTIVDRWESLFAFLYRLPCGPSSASDTTMMTIMIIATVRNARPYPAVRAPATCGRLPTTVASTARPSDPPICRVAFSIPEARPASDASAPEVTVLMVDVISSPRPVQMRIAGPSTPDA